MEHPNATDARQVFEAMAVGDLEPVLTRMVDDFLMVNDIGAGPWRELRGKPQVLEFLGRWAEMFGGTFRQDVLDVVGYDDRVVMIVHEHGDVAGVEFDNRAVYVLEVDAARWSALRTFDMDRRNCERFWAQVEVPAPAEA